GVEGGRSKESKAAALHIERRLNERIDKIEAICPTSSLERSLESELGSLARACAPAERDVERCAKLHVCFRRTQPHGIADVHRNILQSQIPRELARRLWKQFPV